MFKFDDLSLNKLHPLLRIREQIVSELGITSFNDLVKVFYDNTDSNNRFEIQYQDSIGNKKTEYLNAMTFVGQWFNFLISLDYQ